MEEQNLRTFINRDGTQYGPYTRDEAVRYLASGQLRLSDLARRDGSDSWLSLATILGISAEDNPRDPVSKPMKTLIKIFILICIAVPFLFIGGSYVAICVRYQELTNWSIFWDSFKDAFSKTWHENSYTRDQAALLDKVTGTSSSNPSPTESVAEEPSERGKKVVDRSNREEHASAATSRV